MYTAAAAARPSANHRLPPRAPQVAGLWVILGMVAGFALMITGFRHFWLWHEFQEDQKHGTTFTKQATILKRQMTKKMSMGGNNPMVVIEEGPPSYRGSGSQVGASCGG